MPASAEPQAARRPQPDRDARDAQTVERAYRFADLSDYAPKERFLIRAADLAFYWLIRVVGRTTRFRVEGWENWEAAHRDGHVPIYAFWHDQVFLTTYYFRRRRIVVMTSRSFDGEYIARFIQRLGYGAARGSSSRGGTTALAEMVRVMRQNCPTGFTIDGPRGPRHVAKMGAVLLARKTGHPVLPFSVNSARHWAAPSWDRLQVPLPFARALVRIGPPIFVPADADDGQLEAKRDELQRSLDSLAD